jgi:hypothetical protein
MSEPCHSSDILRDNVRPFDKSDQMWYTGYVNAE